MVGCGALGGVLAQNLTRSGVGTLVLVDRDVVEVSNLPRQILFFDDDAREARPKALAAARTLTAIGGPTRLEPHAVQLDADNLATLAANCDLIVDGTDNLATRYLLNDFCVERGLPWVYSGVVGAAGIVLPVLPSGPGSEALGSASAPGACLRCVFPDPPPPGSLDTCESAGVLLPAVAAVASLASGLALRILAADSAAGDDLPEAALIEVDVWNGTSRRIRAPRDPACPCCGERRFPFLHEPSGRRAERLCGRNTVQIPALGSPPDLARLAERLEGRVTGVVLHDVLLRFEVDAHRLTVFRDGRTLVEGTEDAVQARTLFDRYVGA